MSWSLMKLQIPTFVWHEEAGENAPYGMHTYCQTSHALLAMLTIAVYNSYSDFNENLQNTFDSVREASCDIF